MWFFTLITSIFLSVVPIATDKMIFLFDNGEKNQIASMLEYAERHDKAALDVLDFKIVFMGPSVDAMAQEPFCKYAEKLIHYKELGIKEEIDRSWNRECLISQKSLDSLCQNVHIRKKIWVGVSCLAFGQILNRLQQKNGPYGVALRDNPHGEGDTDYFRVAELVQAQADSVALPNRKEIKDKKTIPIGHAPIEQWQEQAHAIDKDAVKVRLGLDSSHPVVVYAGVYGEKYETAFQFFLKILSERKDPDLYVLIVPHPRYKGIVEKRLCQSNSYLRIVGEWEAGAQYLKTVEALSIADVVVTADATSTVVLQANVLGKKALYIHPEPTPMSKKLSANKLLQIVTNSEQLLHAIYAASEKSVPDIFALLDIPREGARLLWEAFIE